MTTPAAAWSEENPTGAVSFGFVDVRNNVSVTQRVRVHNYSNQTLRFNVDASFRFADDEATNAVSIITPNTVVVPANGEKVFNVRVHIDGDKLPANAMSSGVEGANPTPLTLNEYDGYITLEDGDTAIHLAWHVLPRKDAHVHGQTKLKFKSGVASVNLTNQGSGVAQNNAYSLIAVSPEIPEGGRGEQSPTPDIRAVGVNTVPVAAGVCAAAPSFVWEFAVQTWERQAHLLPVSHQLWLDIDQNGTDDYVILNRDASGLSTITDGRQVTWVVNLVSGSGNAFFFAEHSTNTGNTVLRVCAQQLGLTAAALGTEQVTLDVVAQDFYFGGPGDEVNDLIITPFGERYVGTVVPDLAPNASARFEVTNYGAFPGNTPELGVMLITNSDRGAGARGGATPETETILLRP